MKNRVLHWVIPTHEAPHEDYLWFDGSNDPGDEELIHRLLEEAWHYANEG
jgi:hypothetical protein